MGQYEFVRWQPYSKGILPDGSLVVSRGWQNVQTKKTTHLPLLPEAYNSNHFILWGNTEKDYYGHLCYELRDDIKLLFDYSSDDHYIQNPYIRMSQETYDRLDYDMSKMRIKSSPRTTRSHITVQELSMDQLRLSYNNPLPIMLLNNDGNPVIHPNETLGSAPCYRVLVVTIDNNLELGKIDYKPSLQMIDAMNSSMNSYI